MYSWDFLYNFIFFLTALTLWCKTYSQVQGIFSGYFFASHPVKIHHYVDFLIKPNNQCT